MLILNFWEWWMIEYLKKGMTSWNTRHCHFEIELMLPCGGTWSGIWQFGGKLLIDDTDMGSNGERRNHQFTSTDQLRKLNAEIMEREYFSCLNPLQGSKYSPLSLSLFSLKTEITSNLWTNSLYIILCMSTSPSHLCQTESKHKRNHLIAGMEEIQAQDDLPVKRVEGSHLAWTSGSSSFWSLSQY